VKYFISFTRKIIDYYEINDVLARLLNKGSAKAIRTDQSPRVTENFAGAAVADVDMEGSANDC